MSIQDSFRRAQRIVQEKNFAERMKDRITYLAGDNSAIDNAQLPGLSKDKAIILTDDVYRTLKMIGDISNQQGREVPFFLFGKIEKDTGFFIVDRWEAEPSDSQNRYETKFSKNLVQQAMNFALEAQKQENKIIFHGHSHPRVGGYYLNYSLGDVKAYKEMKEKSWMQNVLSGGCLLTGGNFNFSFCDGNDVYRFDNVFVQNRDGELTRLPAFGPDLEIVSRGRARSL